MRGPGSIPGFAQILFFWFFFKFFFFFFFDLGTLNTVTLGLEISFYFCFDVSAFEMYEVGT